MGLTRLKKWRVSNLMCSITFYFYFTASNFTLNLISLLTNYKLQTFLSWQGSLTMGGFHFEKILNTILRKCLEMNFIKKNSFFLTEPDQERNFCPGLKIKFVIFELTNGKWVGFSDSVMKPYNRLPLMDCHFALPASKRELKPSGSTSYSFLCTGRHYNIDIESLLLGGPVLYGLHHPLVPWDGEWHRGSDQGKFSSPDRRASVSIIHYIHQSLVDF